MSGREGVIAVDPRLLKEVLLDDLYARATAASLKPLAAETEAALAESEQRIGDATTAVARAGYCSRIAETDRFERAREDMPWLRDLLAAGATHADVAERLALDEPATKPSPDDPAAATWNVPGPGGHVRHFLAARWVGDGDDAARRAWLYGFFLRCCDELHVEPTQPQ